MDTLTFAVQKAKEQQNTLKAQIAATEGGNAEQAELRAKIDELTKEISRVREIARKLSSKSTVTSSTATSDLQAEAAALEAALGTAPCPHLIMEQAELTAITAEDCVANAYLDSSVELLKDLLSAEATLREEQALARDEAAAAAARESTLARTTAATAAAEAECAMLQRRSTELAALISATQAPAPAPAQVLSQEAAAKDAATLAAINERIARADAAAAEYAAALAALPPRRSAPTPARPALATVLALQGELDAMKAAFREQMRMLMASKE